LIGCWLFDRRGAAERPLDLSGCRRSCARPLRITAGVIAFSSTQRANPMNPKHVHTPVSTRVRCPVCHEAVYSRAGIHPQCAVRQSEPPKPKGKATVVAVPVGVEETVVDPTQATVLVDPPTVES